MPDDNSYSGACKPLFEGNANLLYDTGDGHLYRVSKREVPPSLTVGFYRYWKTLEDYLIPCEVVNSPYGPAVYMERIGREGLVLEFKPKWLLQSPDAPTNALQCRQCARDMARAKRRTWCPLELHSPTKSLMRRMGARDPDAALAYLKSVPLIDSLAKAQSTAPSIYTRDVTKLCDSMTLRDCTVLIEFLNEQKTACTVPYPPRGCYMRGVIVDLDRKSISQHKKWMQQEDALQEWYKMWNPVCVYSNCSEIRISPRPTQSERSL